MNFLTELFAGLPEDERPVTPAGGAGQQGLEGDPTGGWLVIGRGRGQAVNLHGWIASVKRDCTGDHLNWVRNR